jgi:hypothetical protein
VLTIAIKRYTRDDTRTIAYGLFYSVMNVAALLSSVCMEEENPASIIVERLYFWLGFDAGSLCFTV